ncbi:phage tail terminator protein [Pectobacterium actinidiae]|uniref:Phage tail terminator protein n=1 Tax=Pectobacterium actinidiae TaxID=1507808 RepID=A0ABW8GBV6_9GAMM
MIKHSAIRKSVLDALKASVSVDSVTVFDGRPGFLDVEDLPAIAVYLSDAESTDDYLDAGLWRATLHVEVFLRAASPDSELDNWVEREILPVMGNIPDLNELIETTIPQGYEYQRDDEAVTWGSADMKYSLTYYM